MSKALKIVIALLLVIVLGVGGYLFYLFNSPQYTLSRIVKEINENGFTAVEPYLTGNARQTYQKVESLIRNPLVSLALAATPVQKAVSAMSKGAGNLKAEYRDVRQGGKKATITLHLKAASFEGDIQLEMIQENGWKIEDVAIPVGTWIYQ